MGHDTSRLTFVTDTSMVCILTAQQRSEQAAFAEFSRRTGTEGVWLSVSSQPVPEPDLLCTHATDGVVAFELVSLTDSAIAKVQAAGPTARQDAYWTSDPSDLIVRNKLQKKYKTSARQIELLVYTNGQIITPDDAIMPKVLPLFDAIAHPFKRVWFMGELVTCCLWEC